MVDDFYVAPGPSFFSFSEGLNFLSALHLDVVSDVGGGGYWIESARINVGPGCYLGFRAVKTPPEFEGLGVAGRLPPENV